MRHITCGTIHVATGLSSVHACAQMRYMLGDSGRSLIAGWGRNPPTHIQSRAASCPDPPAVCNRVRMQPLPGPCLLVSLGPAAIHAIHAEAAFHDSQ